MSADSAYEAWVLTIRAWSRDPQVSLVGLPELAGDDYSPAVFDRLIAHIEQAIETVTRAWLTRLQSDVGRAHSDFDLAQSLVSSRRLLARRLELAGHPGLPQELRTILTDACTRDITRMQDELEKGFRQARAETPAHTGYWDRRLEVLRTNPITGILPATRPSSVSAANPASSQPGPASSRWAHRRVSPGR
jgi:hypothetical protein